MDLDQLWDLVIFTQFLYLLRKFAEVLCLPKGPDSNSIITTVSYPPQILSLQKPFLSDLDPSPVKLLFTQCFLCAIVHESWILRNFFSKK